MAKYAFVKKDDCIACGSCGSTAPDIFDFDNDGMAEVIFGGDDNRGGTAIPENLQQELQEAVESCPTECIQLAETPFR